MLPTPFDVALFTIAIGGTLLERQNVQSFYKTTLCLVKWSVKYSSDLQGFIPINSAMVLKHFKVNKEETGKRLEPIKTLQQAEDCVLANASLTEARVNCCCILISAQKGTL